MNPTHPTAPASMATPSPWHVGMKPGPIIYGPQGEQIADLTGALSFNAGPNAAFIVRACNSHAQLVGMLEDAALQLGRLSGPSLETYARTFATLARAALTAAQS